MPAPPKWLIRGYITLFALLLWSLDTDFGSCNLSLPSEPVIAGLCLGLTCLFWKKPQVIVTTCSSNILLQISLLYLLWMAISAGFSNLQIVAWKYWLVAAAHWWVFAVGISVWPDLWRRAFPWFAFSMGGLAVYTLLHHSFYDFRTDQAMLAPMPFFPDHTMWAAAVVMVLFLLWGQMGSMDFSPSGNRAFMPIIARPFSAVNGALPDGLKSILPKITTVSFFLLLTALLFSTSRAAWVSLFVAGLVWAFSTFRQKARLVLFLGLIAGGLCVVARLQMPVPRDVSALERLNRWSCAWRMAKEKPVLGFGPGAYKFKYLDFQKPEEMTRISLLKPIAKRGPENYGRGGGAHSEYLQALAETGWPGFLLLLLMVFMSFYKGLSNLKSQVFLPFILALSTFWSHGLVNDFLHDDRIAAMVWGCMAMIFVRKKED